MLGLTRRRIRWLAIGGVVLLPVLLCTGRQRITGQTATEHPYIEPDEISSETCRSCHFDKSEGGFVHSAIEMGCETCHQATSESARTSIVLVAEGGELCLMCHEAKEDAVSHAPYKEAKCLTCHDPHSSDFRYQLRAEVNTVCTACHSENQPNVQVSPEMHQVTLLGRQTTSLESYQLAKKLVLDPSGIQGHPVTGKDPRDGKAALNCTSCHDPHSSQAPTLLRKATESRAANENLCLGCHTDISGQVQKPIQHMAVDMGCAVCHTLHKSEPAETPEGRFHLTMAQPDLCLACHDVSDEAVQQAHLGQPFATSRCSECHNPHGSGRPKLINNFVHSPFEEKQCEICHAEPEEGKVVVIEGGRRALCYMCHSDKQTLIEQAKVPHGLFRERDRCTDCHDPHAASYPHQLRRATVNLCETCHVERREEQMTKQFLHPPVFEVGCTVCHDPHGSDNVRRLRASVNEVCLECHGTKTPELANNGMVKVFGEVEIPADTLKGIRRIRISGNMMRGHPLVGHPISGSNSLKPEAPVLNCASCHNPHASDFTRRRFRMKEGEKSVCLNCH